MKHVFRLWMPVVFTGLVAASVPLSAQAQHLEPTGSGGSIAHLDGLDIEFDSAGNWSKIYSTYVHPVEFPDRRGIKKAQVIAEEKGKAQIVRFLQQEIQSNRLVEEVESRVAKTTMRKGTDKDGTSKTAERTMVESVKEFTRSFASGSLRGVTVIEVGYDEKKEEAWVKVGLSRTTIGIANQLRGEMQNPPRESGGKIGGGQAVNSQPSEVRSRQIP